MNLRNKNIVKVVIFMVATLLILSCGTDNVIKKVDITSEFDENVLKVVTWNLKEFPAAGYNTLNQLQITIPELNADIIAVQEVTNTDMLSELGNLLNDYDVSYSYPYIQQPGANFNPVLGYIYNKNRIQVNSHFTIFREYEYRRIFPRRPYIYDITWQNRNYILINVHLKAMGDNYIDETDPWDEEVRRKEALDTLHAYIIENYNYHNVILLGDFNDEIQEDDSTNVFTAFKYDPDFEFADYEMTFDSSNYSYPRWPSHLDHIIISNEMFDAFYKTESSCYTIKYDQVISGYFTVISDHRPVIIELDYNTGENNE